MISTTDALRNTQTLVYPNWGVAFNHLGMVDNGHSEWHHTMAIEWINVTMPVIDIPDCPKSNEVCNQVRAIAVDLKADTELTISLINLQIQEAKDLIPVQMRHVTRSKRGLFDFVGQASKHLFGLATESELNTVRQHVSAIEKLTKMNANQINRQGKQIATFMKVVDSRIEECLDGIQSNTDLIMTLAEQTNRTLIGLENRFFQLQNRLNVFATALRYLLSYQRNLHTLAAKSSQWINAIHILLKGRLPVDLVSPKRLQHILNDVQQYLTLEYPSFTLSHLSPGYYYESADITYTKTDKHLYITLSLPISASESFFDLFAVMVLPTPTNGTSSNTTEISGHAPFFGIARTGDYYAELSASFYSTCTGGTLKQCPHAISLRHRSIPSCTSSLYFDDAPGIMKHCEIDYRENHLFEGALDLGNSYFLASGKDETWALTCVNKPTKSVSGCKMCVIRVPCSCKLSGTTFIIPTKLTGCDRNVTDVTYLHTVSLTVLHSLFPSDVLKIISGQKSSSLPTRVLLPDLSVQKGSWKKVAKRTNKPTFDFKVMAKAVEEDNTLYATQADYMHNELQATQWHQEPSTSFTFDVLALVIAVIAVIISTVVYRRMRAIAALLTSLTITPQTRANVIVAERIRNFTYRAPWATLKPAAKTQILLDIEWDSVLVKVIFFLLLALVFHMIIKITYKLYATYCFKYRPHKTTLMLELITPRHGMMIPIMSLQGHPSQLFVVKTPQCYSVAVQNRYCTSTLLLEWDDSLIFSTTNGHPVPFPTRIPINYFVGRRLTELAADTYSAKLFLKSASLIRPLQIATALPQLILQRHFHNLIHEITQGQITCN